MPKARNRATLVCLECKRLKSKCDRQLPCSACKKRRTIRSCVYNDSHGSSTLKEIVDRLLSGNSQDTLTCIGSSQSTDAYLSNQMPPKQESIARLISRLPTEEQSKEALRLYFEHRHSLNFRVHWPSFIQRYEGMRTTNTTSLSFIGLVAAIMAQGKQVFSHCTNPSSARSANIECSWNLYQVSLDALNLADSYGLPYDIDYVQAGTLQCDFSMHCIDRSPIERRIWPRLGALITIAMQMGLHRDPEIFDTFSAFDQEMRRRTWWNIYICDRSLSSKLSYPPHINDRECSCKLPANACDTSISTNSTIIENSPDVTEKWFLLYSCHATRINGILRDTELRETEFSTESVEELEASMRLLLASIPKPEVFGPEMEIHRCLAIMCQHASIVRLFNQFIQIPSHPLYTTALASTLTSCHQIVSACFRIVEISQEDNMTTFVPHFCYTPYCFTAGVLIGACLIQNESVVCVQTSRQDLHTALNIFQKITDGSGKDGECARVLEMFCTAIDNSRKITYSENCLTVGPDRYILPADYKNSEAHLTTQLSSISVSAGSSPPDLDSVQQMPKFDPSDLPLFDQVNIGISMDCIESAIFEFDCYGRIM